MPKVKFVVEHLLVEVEAGRRLRAIALDAGVYPNREFLRGVNCGGRGICGTCKVWVHPSSEKSVSPPNIREKIHGAAVGRRLACQTEVLGDIEVTTLPGGDDRLDPKRNIGPTPHPVQDADATRKPIDEASSIAWPLGHPSAVGNGKIPESADKEIVKAGAKPVANRDQTPGEKPAEAKGDAAKEKPAEAKGDAAKEKPAEAKGDAAKEKPAEAKGEGPPAS